MISKIGPSKLPFFSTGRNELPIGGKPFFADQLVSSGRRPRLVKILLQFWDCIWDVIKAYFLFCFYDEEGDAAREAAEKLHYFFNIYLDAQENPIKENKARILQEFERLDPMLQEKITECLLKIIKEEVQPDQSEEKHQATLRQVLQDPFIVFRIGKVELCVMAVAIARAKESFHVIILGDRHV